MANHLSSPVWAILEYSSKIVYFPYGSWACTGFDYYVWSIHASVGHLIAKTKSNAKNVRPQVNPFFGAVTSPRMALSY